MNVCYSIILRPLWLGHDRLVMADSTSSSEPTLAYWSSDLAINSFGAIMMIYLYGFMLVKCGSPLRMMFAPASTANDRN